MKFLLFFCSQFGPRSGLTEHGSRSRSNPFDTDSVPGSMFLMKLIFDQSILIKVRKAAKIRNQYNQVPHLT